MHTRQDETDRLKELARYAILDTPTDETFDELTSLAAQHFNVPIAIISIVDRDRVWFKSAYGLNAPSQADRGPGLCASAIQQNAPYIAPDLRLDVESRTNPLVTRENGFRFYAATQLRSPAGFNLGTFCIVDVVPREIDADKLKALKKFGRLAMSQIEHHLASRKVASLLTTAEEQSAHLSHAATHDSLTGLLNRYAIQAKLNELTSRAEQAPDLSILLFDIDQFKSIIDTYGHREGDAVLIEVSKRIASTVRANDFVGRHDGEEFIVLLATSNKSVLSEVAERIRCNVSKNPILVEGKELWITISGGASTAQSGIDPESMMRVADTALSKAKQRGRNRFAYCNELDELPGKAKSDQPAEDTSRSTLPLKQSAALSDRGPS